jgi:hypothetical protein
MTIVEKRLVTAIEAARITEEASDSAVRNFMTAVVDNAIRRAAQGGAKCVYIPRPEAGMTPYHWEQVQAMLKGLGYAVSVNSQDMRDMHDCGSITVSWAEATPAIDSKPTVLRYICKDDLCLAMVIEIEAADEACYRELDHTECPPTCPVCGGEMIRKD